MHGKRVIVGLSGGVDSSVAAYLLLQQGYEVIGLFMKNWHDDSVTISDECPWLEDSNDAMLVADKLGIPFQTVDLSEQYKARIVDYMFDEYEKGRTPNPDILCNREIKFKSSSINILPPTGLHVYRQLLKLSFEFSFYPYLKLEFIFLFHFL